MSEGAPPLVSTAWVAERLDDPGLVVVEVDEDTSAYDVAGHVPGAIAFHWREDLQQPGRPALVDREGFAALMDRKGVRREDHVVVYGGSYNWFAAFAYWCLRLYGHPRVSLMDGGRRAWVREQRPLSYEPAARPATRGYAATGPDPELRVARDEVLERFVGAPEGTAVLDVRTPEEYRGERTAPDHLPDEGARTAGHIPGAANVPWETAVDPQTGRFLPPGRLRELYEAAGVAPTDEVVTYCRIGERSAHTWFVLHELLGHPRVRNYDGSWAEYGSLVDAPVER